MLRDIADDKVAGVLITDTQMRRIHHPYDGGADDFLTTRHHTKETALAIGIPTGSPAMVSDSPGPPRLLSLRAQGTAPGPSPAPAPCLDATFRAGDASALSPFVSAR
ncbi:DUF3885 domain-containing protein, partial [Streptomyces flaveolus]|uniref:DUF3885 domain-containing protein n=1 Tax=Streptomyces flaveolus TaxID=67297 RepID=UPI003F4CF13B